MGGEDGRSLLAGGNLTRYTSIAYAARILGSQAAAITVAAARIFKWSRIRSRVEGKDGHFGEAKENYKFRFNFSRADVTALASEL